MRQRTFHTHSTAGDHIVRHLGRIAVLVAAIAITWAPVASAAPNDGPGTIRLQITAPSGGTALIEVTRVDAPAPVRTVMQSPVDNNSRDVTIESGTYQIMPRAMFAGDQRYVAKSDPLQVRVQTGKVTESKVVYRLSKGVQNLHATGLTATSVALDWDAELGDDTAVWRTVGDHPATRQGQGTRVTLTGSSLVDTGLAPGTTYSYAIFARPGDGAFGRTEGDPVTITVGTAPDGSGSGQQLFVLNPRASV
ncbi:MAG: fibronectin type III domain-containing protein, partial [Actinobacteria bacterium]|nr:fibronectin type III domain-containing protein [Actinomycetota bacterium]